MIERPKTVLTPFQVDSSTGKIAVTNDPVRIIGQHIVSIVATEPYERPMRPTYGAGLRAYLFEPTDRMAEVQDDVMEAVRVWEPKAVIRDVTPLDRGDGAIAFKLSYTLRDDPNMAVNNAVVQIGGTVTEVDTL